MAPGRRAYIFRYPSRLADSYWGFVSLRFLGGGTGTVNLRFLKTKCGCEGNPHRDRVTEFLSISLAGNESKLEAHSAPSIADRAVTPLRGPPLLSVCIVMTADPPKTDKDRHSAWLTAGKLLRNTGFKNARGCPPHDVTPDHWHTKRMTGASAKLSCSPILRPPGS